MPKELPVRVYNRGDQGTFVYSPDINVYVQTDEYGVVDLSPYITNFTLQRNVNGPSMFACSFDNKFARFDRVLRRMNRIVVFLKRVQWMQVFAGYITVAPWETVVPGDAMLMADCTLKRLVYTYWDPHSIEGESIYPARDSSTLGTADGGAAIVAFKLLTVVADWNKSNIQIQQIPEAWLKQAVKIVKQNMDEDFADIGTRVVRDNLIKLLDADGWLGGPLGDVLNADAANDSTASRAKWIRNSAGGLRPLNGVDQEWQRLVGMKKAALYPPGFGNKPPLFSGGPNVKQRLANSQLFDTHSNFIYLRPDAAASLNGLFNEVVLKNHNNLEISTHFLSYDKQVDLIKQQMKAFHHKPGLACQHTSCPAGISDHGWGIAIDFDTHLGPAPSEEIMHRYGWLNVPSGIRGTGLDTAGTQGEFDKEGQNTNHWVFVGNYREGWPAYVTAKDKPKMQGRGQHVTYVNTSKQFDWSNADALNLDSSVSDSIFKTIYYSGAAFDPIAAALVGKRAWLNDVSVLQSVMEMMQASMRDFQSAPNGDFIAFFPDRLGIYGKAPSMQIRDIEVIDFKVTITDKQLVTHAASVGDVVKPLEMQSGVDTDLIMFSGYVSVEQPEVMKLILGLEETPEGLGDWILQRFGMRPQVQNNASVMNYGFNWLIALHMFEEAWSLQWQVLASFTFMPELYPGMRIELVDHGISVYVESVTHQGDRATGFSTQAMISTPMRRDPKTGKLHLLRMEFDPQQFIGNEDEIPGDLGETEDQLAATQAKLEFLRSRFL